MILLPARYNGPARSANGGYTAGSLAERVPGDERLPVEVTLRQPPPLETAMHVEESDDRLLLVVVYGAGGAGEGAGGGAGGGAGAGAGAGRAVVAEARRVSLELPPVETVAPAAAAEAMQRYPGLRRHPFPTCFACGPDREPGDGLRIFPGPVAGDRGHVASVWTPAPGHAESSDLVDGVQRCGIATTWAALDCVGGWSEDLEGRPSVLGRMTARLDALPVVGEPHVVVGRHLGAEGRKAFTASTLYDADGRVVAAARHTWIQVDPAAFN